MSFLCTLIGLSQIFALLNANINSWSQPRDEKVVGFGNKDSRKWYILDGTESGMLGKSFEEVCEKPLGAPEMIMLPNQPEVYQSVENLVVDWTQSWPCGAFAYTVELTDRSGNARSRKVDGRTTRAVFTNISSCETLDVCINAFAADGMNGTVCRLNWKPEKTKPAIIGTNLAFGKLSVSWSLNSVCQPIYFQLHIRKGQEIMHTHVVPGTSLADTMNLKNVPAPFVILVAAYFSDFEATVSEPVEVQKNKEEGQTDVYCGPPRHRRIAHNSQMLIAQKNSDLDDPRGEKILGMAQNVTCPILYYILSSEVKDSNFEVELPRGQCTTVSPKDLDAYAVRISLVTSASQVYMSDEIKLEGKKHWIVCSTDDLKITLRPSEPGGISPQSQGK